MVPSMGIWTIPILSDGQFCPICLEKFTSPRQLPCLHSFCEHCLRDYITTIARSTEISSNDFLCPVCSAVTKPANRDKPLGEWASLFPNNPFLVGKVDRFCEVCLNSSGKSAKRAKKFCVVCEECLCDVCAVCHQNMKISKGHQIITIEEFDNDPENRIKRKRLSEGFGCLEHDNDNIKFYCRSHEIACCATCSFLHHKACEDVLELQHNIPCLLKEINAQKVSKQLDDLKGKLKKFVEINKEIIGILRSQVDNIPTEIRDLRIKVNAVLDKTEKKAKLEGNRIYEEWLIRKQEQNKKCQSLANAIGNSQALLNTVSQYGSDTQKFLVTSKTTKLLHWYTDQVREKFEKLDNIKIRLELDRKMNAALSKDDVGLVKIECQEEVKDLQCISLMIPLQKRTVELSKVIVLKSTGEEKPMYVGMVHLSDGYLLLADYNNKTCCMYDSSYNLITSCILNGQPNDMCLIGNNQVAITIPVTKASVHPGPLHHRRTYSPNQIYTSRC
ncbi:hypothetical protein CHS0354_018084 [Potamilus streckersoni]|uniref:Uncharacterized protein n=1 Tax=Potamilus streckersoni TaxID=2493646 RepID=A0AAE0TJL6_9BIVA|nr:hypothetical protein CHS0354_018084 [Potamilus streckersoni]